MKASESTTPSLGALDFPPDRTAVRVREVAEKLNVGTSSVNRWIDLGELVTIDVSTAGAKATRHARRIEIGSYRAFIRRRCDYPEALGNPPSLRRDAPHRGEQNASHRNPKGKY